MPRAWAGENSGRGVVAVLRTGRTGAALRGLAGAGAVNSTSDVEEESSVIIGLGPERGI